MLNPKITKDPAGVFWLQWTPDPSAEGYAFTTPGGQSRTFDPSLSQTKLGKPPEPIIASVAALDVTARPAEHAAYPINEPGFGTRLYEGYEWSQQQISGKTTLVSTKTELVAAIASSADIIRGSTPGLVLDITELKLPAHTSFRAIEDLTLRNGRILKPVTSKWRLKNVTVQFGSPEDDVKGDNDGAFLHLDRCDIAHAPRQGMLLYHSDIVAEYTRFHHNGSAIDVNLDHGIYGAHGKRLLETHCTHYENYAYALQLYPSWQQARLAQCTYYGGTSRGGAVFGSENPVGGNNPKSSSDLRWIGCISANSPTYGWTQYKEALRCSIEYCVGWNNRQGDYTIGFQPVGFVHGDPKFKSAVDGDFSILPGSAARDLIPQALWPWVTSADAGSGLRVAA